VSRLVEQERETHERKANDAACVRQTLPLGGLGGRGHPVQQCCNTAKENAPALDSDPGSGVIIVTQEREDPCRNETTASSPRARPSSRRAR
jgi:hypothetical protein